MILTASDVLKMATDQAKQAAAAVEEKRQSNKQINANDDSLPIQPGLKILGPNGTQKFFRSLRHFMRRDSFSIDIREGACLLGGSNGAKTKKNKKYVSNNESFKVESFSAYAKRTDSTLVSPSKKRPRTADNSDPQKSQHDEILSFLFTTPPIQGRFLIEKAKSLGVPRGPMYGKLKSGKSVTFENQNGESVTVHSHQVVEPGSPGVVVAVLSYPSLEVLEQLQNSAQLKQFHPSTKKETTKPILELVVHMAPRSVFESCASWRNSSFDKSVRHMFVCTQESMDSDEASRSLSAFQSAHSGAHLRSKISASVFCAPMANYEDATSQEEAQRDSVVDAFPLLEYVLLPRAKRGFTHHDLFLSKWKSLQEEAKATLNSSGCIDRARQILEDSKSISVENNGEILFTGTGSAVPCKHRNVSGIYVRMENDNAMLLDVGEGTIGQLLRAKQHRESNLSQVIEKIKAVWISHPHADHHLGILRLLEERKRLLGQKDPLVLIAPPNILGFLQDYDESVNQTVADSYIFLDCRTISTKANYDRKPNSAALERLKQDLGITSAKAIPVAHCAHSFAVVFEGTSFGSLAYSGDCRPSLKFAQEAYNADVLIHEATFADGMEADALLKRHCTAGEALMVARDMNAKTTILTHFSQRYPKIPLMQNKENNDDDYDDNDETTEDSKGTRVIHAFDFMRITPSNMHAASKLTPALQMLYPEESDDAASDENVRAALQVPGLFAQSALL